MLTYKYDIAFELLLDNGASRILLHAEVEELQSNLYSVKNFWLRDRTGSSLLPEMEIVKKDGSWVHRDSGKETNLSLAIGEAVDSQKKARQEV